MEPTPQATAAGAQGRQQASLASQLIAEPQPTPAEAHSLQEGRLHLESGAQPRARTDKGGRAARPPPMPLGAFLQGPRQPRANAVRRQTAADSTNNMVRLINKGHLIPACLLSQAI